MPTDGFMGIKSNFYGSSGFENTFMIIGNQSEFTLGALRDLVVVTSKRLIAEMENKIKRDMLKESFRSLAYSERKVKEHNDFIDKNKALAEENRWTKKKGISDMFGYGWQESYIYGFQVPVQLMALWRKALQEGPIQVAPSMTQLDDWTELWRYRKYSYEGASIEGDVEFADPRFTEPRSYIAVIDDERVSITRVSGHGGTGVRFVEPVSLEKLIDTLKERAGVE